MKDVDFQALWTRACVAGMKAGEAVKPYGMVVRNNDGQVWNVPEGPCGFAWIVVKPGNCAFAKWAKRAKSARAEYGGGMCVRWVSEFNQSHQRKEAYAYAFAEVINEAGIKAVGRSRMD